MLCRTGRIMTSGHSWGHYMCPTVFSMIKGKNTCNLFHFLYPPLVRVCTASQLKCRILGLNRLCPPAGTLHWAAWTTLVETRPCRWWMGGGWRDTSQPTSWRTKKRSETPAPDAVSPLTVTCCWRSQIFRSQIAPSLRTYESGKHNTGVLSSRHVNIFRMRLWRKSACVRVCCLFQSKVMALCAVE